MAAGNDALDVLKQINTKLDTLIALAARAATAPAPQNPWNGPAYVPTGQGTPPPVASDYDLDGPYGDPEVKAKSPRDWTGPSMQGKHFSECPAEYLDLVADRLLYFAAQNAADTDPEAQKKARYNRLDAGRAKGWAARIRAGYTPTPKAEAEPVADAFADSDVPF